MFHRFLNTPLYTGISVATITIFVKNYTLDVYLSSEYTAQKMKFSVKDFFSKCDQIQSFLRNWFHLLKQSSMENFIFGTVTIWRYKENRIGATGEI